MGHEAEWGFTLVAALFAAAAAIHGWRRHRSMGIATAFGVGIAALLLSRALEEGGPPELGTAAGVLAGAVLVMAHVLNLRTAPHRMRTSCAASSAAELADS